MLALVVVALVMLFLVATTISANLGRIADALDAQNRAYGVEGVQEGVPEP